MTQSLGEALPQEISRCQELLAVYQNIGPAGFFGAGILKAHLDAGVKALAEGDVVAMIRAYEELKKCE